MQHFVRLKRALSASDHIPAARLVYDVYPAGRQRHKIIQQPLRRVKRQRHLVAGAHGHPHDRTHKALVCHPPIWRDIQLGAQSIPDALVADVSIPHLMDRHVCDQIGIHPDGDLHLRAAHQGPIPASDQFSPSRSVAQHHAAHAAPLLPGGVSRLAHLAPFLAQYSQPPVFSLLSVSSISRTAAKTAASKTSMRLWS